MTNYMIAQLDEIDPVECPCGLSRRAFISPENPTVTMHMVEISADNRGHYHKKLTEIYFVLDGQGHMELDGERFEMTPGTAVLIKPGCRHRAVGNLRVILAVVPAHDPDDEWFD